MLPATTFKWFMANQTQNIDDNYLDDSILPVLPNIKFMIFCATTYTLQINYQIGYAHCMH